MLPLLLQHLPSCNTRCFQVAAGSSGISLCRTSTYTPSCLRPAPDTTRSAMSILVDDSNPLVQYSPPGGWFTSGNAAEFGATTHVSATPGATATLVFEGISIGVYGTIASTSGPLSLNFSIDGVDIDSYQAPLMLDSVPNQFFWTSTVFNETQHTLVVTVNHIHDTLQSPTPAFFLDYFIYNTTSTAGKTLLIDDTDGSVTYSPEGWQSFNSTDNSLERTQHVSTLVGSWAAASFNGTAISLFGPPGQEGFSASIIVDGSQPVISQSQNTENQLFNASGLSSGPHTINVTVVEGILGIDYFVVSNSGNSAPITPQSQPVPSPSYSSGTSQFSKKPPIAVIVGGAIGGLIILVMLLAIIIWQRRRRAGPILPRWVGSEIDHDSLSVTAPRPFQPSELADPPPPPYTLKYLPVVRQWIAQ
ncbi:hypothetical protein MSAN_01134700 [Mycena sanguinolenta]|uniref:Transmembrane protein n=1 Tax=Mycena sanguinolenta TaxID=230812 RepID=A0A8H6YLX0_9AGAR|nr:hypothetical protein MSAN_01134700 [Mycena sanguinolenta]